MTSLNDEGVSTLGTQIAIWSCAVLAFIAICLALWINRKFSP